MELIKNIWNTTDANIILKKSKDNGNLWLGNAKAALNLNYLIDNNISVIVNCSVDIPYIYDILEPEELCKNKICLNLETFRIPVFDSLLPHDLYLMEQYFPKVLPFIIQKLITEKKNVFIGCFAGKMRSAAVVAALLYTLKQKENTQESKNKCMKEVIKFIVKCRPQAFRYGYKINFKQSLENYFKINI